MRLLIILSISLFTFSCQSTKTTSSGIEYKILKEGNGPKPRSRFSNVKVKYKGMLENGKVFDSRNSVFNLNRVIRGWKEIIPMMPAGSKWRVKIPPHLAYGSRGKGSIPPNSTLIFEIELLSSF